MIIITSVGAFVGPLVVPEAGYQVVHPVTSVDAAVRPLVLPLTVLLTVQIRPFVS